MLEQGCVVRVTRTVAAGVVLALGVLGGAAAAAPGANASAADASGAGDIALIGDHDNPAPLSSGYKYFSAGPVAGAPTARVDAADATVTVSVTDTSHGGTASITMAWPARPGTWSLDFTGPDPEQTMKLTRGSAGCTFTAGSLTIYRADATATGDVAALSADVDGSCSISGGGTYSGARIRIADPDPTRLVAIPRATPASISTGALAGTPVAQDVTVGNTGSKPWKVGAVAVASTNSWSPRFKVAAEANHCTGVTLATGETCTVQVSMTAPAYLVTENLMVGGDAGATLVVPLRFEGYNPVEPPSSLTAQQGRASATLSWQPPSVLPRVGYRVYDTTSGARTLVASAAASATSVNVPGAGPRTLALVAANGTFAESTDVTVSPAKVDSEVVGNDWYGASQSVVTDATTSQARTLSLERVDLDPSRTLWVTPAYSDVRVCPVATEECTTVPGTTSTSDADTPYEAIWMPDGTIAFLRGWSSELRALWVVRRDGSGLRKVASVPERSQLAAVPTGGEVVLRNSRDDRLERVRLSDGRTTVVPATSWVDDFTVSTQGLLVLERRADPAAWLGDRVTTVMRLDGTGARRLALPAGDNREVVFDPTGTKVAFARYTDTYEATLWVARADGSAARELSPASTGWRDLKWSTEDVSTPGVSVTVPAFTTRTATLSVSATDADDASGSLRRQCRLDAAAAWADCGSTVTYSGLAAGSHRVTARSIDPAGRVSTEANRSWLVDASAPTASLAAPASVQTTVPTTLSWTAADTGGSGLATYDVRARVATRSAGFGAYQYPAAWQGLTARTMRVTLTRGSQYCYSVRSHDKAGNVGAWSAERCTALPLDDRDLAAGRGWTLGSSPSYLFGTYSRTTTFGAQLSVGGVRGRRLVVVATTCSTCGSIDVYHAGVKLGRVSLYSATTRTRQVLWLPLEPVTRYGTVVVRSAGTKQVVVDGVAVGH
ncbi:hypothetical protein ASG70_14400 [Phycicoccus sp. Soil748]|nr:hypothetical protein ASG70_14400 [Phycicoccus sp. Soil748]